MNELIIASFFTRNGNPAIGITGGYPLIQIWLANASPGFDTYVGQFVMTEVNDVTNDADGFYKYIFTTTNGWDPTQTYLFRTDGGPTLAAGERYQAGQQTPAEVIQNVSAEVWNATAASYTAAGSMGLLENQIAANTLAIANNLYLNAGSVLDLVQLLVQYETNRTKIDPVACTLTVYEDDCVTPLRVFKLLDTTSTPSITEVAERKPISANDGQPVCL